MEYAARYYRAIAIAFAVLGIILAVGAWLGVVPWGRPLYLPEFLVSVAAVLFVVWMPAAVVRAALKESGNRPRLVLLVKAAFYVGAVAVALAVLLGLTGRDGAFAVAAMYACVVLGILKGYVDGASNA